MTTPIKKSTGARSPSATGLVARAAALRGLLQEEAADHDRERRLSDRTVGALREAGLLRLTVPRALGGHEVDMRTLLDVAVELGRGCTSTSWVTSVVSTGNYLIGMFPEETRKDVWGANPDACAIGVLTPTAQVERAEGGVRVTGKWAYSSGSQIADWAMLGIPYGGTAEAPGISFALMPMNELTVQDTWHVMGMRGTASNTVCAENVLVPERRLLSVQAVMGEAFADQFPDEPLYQTNLAGTLVMVLLGAQLGAVRTALEYVREKAPQRSISATFYPDQSESVAFQMDLAEAANKIDTAGLLLHRLADVLDDHAKRGERIDLELRARNRVDGATASQLVKDAMDLLVSAHGTSAFADSNPLQRIFRDLNVASRHAGTGVRVPRELYGKAMLGKNPFEITFLL
jgi:3-hydroxy-9,10-secoandrosta-1,3,5(10)-triene-9,17-dione monooxygenase